jgi:CHASE2 domain-containing sensor protein
VPTGVPGPAVTAIGPRPVQGRPVNGFLPKGGGSIVVLGAGETGTGGSWVTVFPLRIGLVVFPLSIGLLVFCASAIVMVAVRPRTLRPISAMRFTGISDLPIVAPPIEILAIF